MANGEWLVPFVALASLDRASRDRATDPLVLTMLPGSAAQKTAVAAVAVTQQAQDGVRQERRVAEQTVEAVSDALADPAKFDRSSLENLPALRTIASDDLVARIKEVQAPAAVVDEAVAALQAAIAGGKDQKLAAADMAKYPVLTERMTDAQKNAVFQ